MIHDTKAVIEVVGEDAIISICPELHSRWNLHSYMSRYGKLSLDQKKHHRYYLSLDDCHLDHLSVPYETLELGLRKFQLHRLESF